MLDIYAGIVYSISIRNSKRTKENKDMTNAIRETIERAYNAEYKKGREKNFFLRNWFDDNGKCWFELAKITKSCGFTVKCTDDEAEMVEFMKDYKLVKVFA